MSNEGIRKSKVVFTPIERGIERTSKIGTKIGKKLLATKPKVSSVPSIYKDMAYQGMKQKKRYFDSRRYF